MGKLIDLARVNQGTYPYELNLFPANIANISLFFLVE